MPKPIEDEYGNDLQVNVEFGGDEVTVSLGITETIHCSPPAPLARRTETTYSKLTAPQARELASQLQTAADEVEGVGGRG